MQSPRKPVVRNTRTAAAREAARKRTRTKRLITIVAVFVVLVTLAVLFVRLPFFRIRTIEVSGNQLVKTEDITATVQAALEENHGLFVPNSHVFLLPKKELEKTLANTFPRLAQVAVEHSAFHKMGIDVVERPHTYLWCTNTTLAECYFADDTGLLFAKAPYFSGTVYVTFVGGNVNLADPIDSHIIDDADEFKKILLVINAFEDADFVIAGVSIGRQYDYTLRVPRIQGHRTPDADVVINTGIEVETALANIKLAMDTEKFKQSFLAHPDALDYIDARLPEKVFYKFGVTQVAPQSATPTNNPMPPSTTLQEGTAGTR